MRPAHANVPLAKPIVMVSVETSVQIEKIAVVATKNVLLVNFVFVASVSLIVPQVKANAMVFVSTLNSTMPTVANVASSVPVEWFV